MARVTPRSRTEGELGHFPTKLNHLTGIEYDVLVGARQPIVRTTNQGSPTGFRLDGRLEALYEDLGTIKDRYIPPSAQYLRSQ